MYLDTLPYSLVLCAVSNLEYNATALNYNSRTKRVTNLAFPITHLPSVFNHIANRLTTASFPSPSGKQFNSSWNRGIEKGVMVYTTAIAVGLTEAENIRRSINRCS